MTFKTSTGTHHISEIYKVHNFSLGEDNSFLEEHMQRARSNRIPPRRFFTASVNSSDDIGKPSSQYWSYNVSTGRAQRPIFVAATKQHVGKTTTSLALLSGLKKRFEKVGFIKPVGQQHLKVPGSGNQGAIRVDKDVVLMREHFDLSHIEYQDMSPVIIPQGTYA
jgi:hypothetical protein